MAKELSFKELFSQFQHEEKELEDAIMNKMHSLIQPMEDFRRGLSGKGDKNMAGMELKAEQVAKAAQGNLAGQRKSGEQEARDTEAEHARIRATTPLDKLGGILAQGMPAGGFGETAETRANAKLFGEKWDKQDSERGEKRKLGAAANAKTPVFSKMANIIGGASMGEDLTHGLKGAAGHIGKALNSDSGSATVAEGFNAAGSIAGSMGPYGKAVEGALKLAGAVFTASDKITEFSKKTYEANIQFAKYSGAMSGVQARQEVRDMQLEKAKGDVLAESAEDQAQSKANADKRRAGFDTKIQDWKNKASSFGNNLQERFFSGLERLGINKSIEDKMKEAGNTSTGLTWMNQAGEEWVQKYARPARWGNK